MNVFGTKELAATLRASLREGCLSRISATWSRYCAHSRLKRAGSVTDAARVEIQLPWHILKNSASLGRSSYRVFKTEVDSMF